MRQAVGDGGEYASVPGELLGDSSVSPQNDEMWIVWSVRGLPFVLIPKRCTLGALDVFVHGVFVAPHSRFYYADRLAVDKEAPTVGVALNGSHHAFAVPEGDEAHAFVADWHESPECSPVAFQEGVYLSDTVDYPSMADG